MTAGSGRPSRNALAMARRPNPLPFRRKWAILALREIADRDQKLVLFTGIREARFRRPVVPGDTLVLEVTALRFGPRIQRMRGEAKVDGQLCADAELMSVIADRPTA